MRTTERSAMHNEAERALTPPGQEVLTFEQRNGVSTLETPFFLEERTAETETKPTSEEEHIRDLNLTEAEWAEFEKDLPEKEETEAMDEKDLIEAARAELDRIEKSLGEGDELLRISIHTLTAEEARHER